MQMIEGKWLNYYNQQPLHEVTTPAINQQSTLNDTLYNNKQMDENEHVVDKSKTVMTWNWQRKSTKSGAVSSEYIKLTERSFL